MRAKEIFIAVLTGMLIASLAGAAGVSETNAVPSQSFVQRRDIYWNTQVRAGGAVTGTVSKVDGRIERVTFIPGAAPKHPANAYDITLKDEDGVDVLAGLGANLSSNVTSCVVPGITIDGGTNRVCFTVQNSLTLTVSNATSNRIGIVRLYIRP